GGDASPVHPGQPIGVIADLQRAEAFEAGVLRTERELGAAVAADQRRRRTVRYLADSTIDGCGHARPLSSSFPHRGHTRGPELAPNSLSASRTVAMVAGASPGRSLCPSG